MANVFDKNEDISIEGSYDKKIVNEDLERNGPPERNKSVKMTYYQVLIDNRDIPYIRTESESVTFLGGPQSNRSVYSIYGLDYVSHSDILPYSSTEKNPIIHDLFEKFLMPEPESSKKKTFVLILSIHN